MRSLVMVVVAMLMPFVRLVLVVMPVRVVAVRLPRVLVPMLVIVRMMPMLIVRPYLTPPRKHHPAPSLSMARCERIFLASVFNSTLFANIVSNAWLIIKYFAAVLMCVLR